MNRGSNGRALVDMDGISVGAAAAVKLPALAHAASQHRELLL
jgi:hypothetical protein